MIRHAPSIGIGIGISLRSDTLGAPGLLDLYGGAAAAYSLRALSRGWLAGDVVEVRRSSDSTTDSFTASQITSGAMLDFVNNDTTDLYSDDYQYFNGVDTKATFAQETYSGDFYFEFDALAFTSGRLFSGTLGSSARFLGGNLEITDTSATTASFPISAYSGALNRYKLEKISGQMRCYVNGVEVGAAQSFATFNLRDFGNFGGSWLTGLLGDFDVNGIHMYAFKGVSPFTDTIGSKNLSTSGNFETYTGQPFDGFVSTWYDQSGNANDATQATTTAQPKIVDAGSLVTGGLDFDGTDDSLFVSGNPVITASFAGTYSTFSVQDAPLGVTGYLFGNASEANGSSILSRSANTYSVTNANAGNFDEIARLSGENLLSSVYNNNSVEMKVNGAGTTVDSTPYDFAAGTSDFRIGSRNPDNVFYAGKLNEIIVYNTDQSANRAAIETNINDHYNIYA